MKKFFLLFILVAICACFANSSFALFLKVKETEPSVGSSTSKVEPKKPEYYIQKFYLKFSRAKEISDMIKDLLAEGEGVSVSEKLNTIAVRASTKTIDNITKVISQIDIPPLQVQVEAKIIEFKKGNGDSSNPETLGLNWTYTNPSDSNDYARQIVTNTVTQGVTGASSFGFFAQIFSGNISAYLKTLSNKIGYNLIASPWVSALNHEESEILIGSKIGYTTLLTTTTGTLQEVNFLEVGTKLKFTPHISDDGFIIMEIYPAISEGTVVNGLPQENTTQTSSKVLVKDSQSIVIGGLTKNYTTQVEYGVPFLSQIPFVGTLFRQTQLQSEKREIMVIITPHIVTPAFLEEMAQRGKNLENRIFEKENNSELIH
ncbi:hypothetical protein A3J90_08540 [candidate division WOR-1 bacterium RIFOXYC2_FULL_37_10]|uniref:Uncharacterized protein n=1 Tax=candidate division WOR-1 bacterium RIFOXYB2_FULL_37_13 TaxID=1802579 RepID=A0A1F4SMC0_UNCSA|nr:MAG: hypothetical protein A2246_01645 [candidate division WOR-1 bacterium RIFOXYA2_FULL_37_7]OGC21598.1 MAG: hypothetical protein A2310_02230 [candidate division WOR-1 bacterium RIFOXYB2_FULL_37_13]OGC33024.1 MAG: hypothetical protein A3J90_08540 [candidate division WOR-1 bacterium RIFOXYC2_FULL_37_10]